MKSTFRVATIAFQNWLFSFYNASPFQPLHLSKQGTLTFQNVLDENDFLFCGQVRTIFLFRFGEGLTALQKLPCLGFFFQYTEVNKNLATTWMLRNKHRLWCKYFILCTLRNFSVEDFLNTSVEHWGWVPYSVGGGEARWCSRFLKAISPHFITYIYDVLTSICNVSIFAGDNKIQKSTLGIVNSVLMQIVGIEGKHNYLRRINPLSGCKLLHCVWI